MKKSISGGNNINQEKKNTPTNLKIKVIVYVKLGVISCLVPSNNRPFCGTLELLH